MTLSANDFRGLARVKQDGLQLLIQICTLAAHPWLEPLLAAGAGRTCTGERVKKACPGRDVRLLRMPTNALIGLPASITKLASCGTPAAQLLVVRRPLNGESFHAALAG